MRVVGRQPENVSLYTHGSPEGLYDHGIGSTPIIVSKNNISNLPVNTAIHFIMMTACETAGGVESVDYDFGLIKKFMEETGIPVVLGEFGLNLDKATDEDMDTYIRYITTFCETNNIPWTYWQYRDGYSSEGSMSLYRKTSYFGSVQWDEDALNALFLK